MLRLESSRSPKERYELPLPSGSVYIQRRGDILLGVLGETLMSPQRCHPVQLQAFYSAP